MQNLKRILISLLLIIPGLSWAHPIANPNSKIPNSMANMLKKVNPAVVNIAVEKVMSGEEEPFELRNKPPRKELAVGSGVIINAKEGLIVTNAHVVQDEKIMIVTLKSGRRFRAKLIGKDSGFDIAIIQIHAKQLTSIPFGDSDQLRVGDFVAAIGSPFGLTQTVTSGVISALNRSQPKIEGFQSFIQTDAPINPGNSGGALVNMQGQLIGINTAIFTPMYGNIGIGFAIPSNMVHSVVKQLLKYGEVKRGMLGVIAQNISPNLADAMHLKHMDGTIVAQVVHGSPASIAGIHVQDVIESVNGRRIHTAAQLRNMLGLMRPNTPIKITVIRNGKIMTISTKVGDPQQFMAQRATPFIAGLELQDFNELEGDGTQLQGVLVAGVDETSAAALAGLRPGDVITSANGKPTTSVKTLKEIAENKSNQLLLKISRNNMSMFLVIENS